MATTHRLLLGDARDLGALRDGEVHLVVTSPPYWTLKQYNQHPNQLGAIEDYHQFLDELDAVWQECCRVLAPGGRMCTVVGDVCLSRRKAGRHRVIPLHADITTRCVALGLDNLAPIFWYKIANIQTEMDRPGYFLGKPYEPNGIIKNDVEYILLLRKPGQYRHPSEQQRKRSRIPKEDYHRWYRQIWDDVGGATTRDHPAPYPVEIAERLIRMFSFADDTVLDPFLGTGTTTIAAIQAGRNSVGVEVDSRYLQLARRRVLAHDLPSDTHLSITGEADATETFSAPSLLYSPHDAHGPRTRRSRRAQTRRVVSGTNEARPPTPIRLFPDSGDDEQSVSSRVVGNLAASAAAG